MPRELTGEPFVPREVRFTHAVPPDIAPHEALFRCRVRFGQRASELLFSATELGLPRHAPVATCIASSGCRV